MKFRHVNVSNLRDLLPRWACDYMQIARIADALLDRCPRELIADPYRVLKVSLEFDLGTSTARLCEPADQDGEYFGALILKSRQWRIDFQLNYALRSYESIAGKHCVYSHGHLTDTPLGYIGITKRPWFVRYAEHESSARKGSRLLFHEVIRRHAATYRHHRIWAAGLGLDVALELEERLVGACSLYPIGLNMIPGGRAGLQYLASLSIRLDTTEQAPEAIAAEMERPSTEGRPNPLCSARWESDPSYAARVICGHSGRLTVEQVQMIRAMHSTCRTPAEIAMLAGARNTAQVERLLSARTYRRVG